MSSHITPEECDAAFAIALDRHGHEGLARCYVEWIGQLPYLEESITGHRSEGVFVRRKGTRYRAYSKNLGILLGEYNFDPENHTPGHLWDTHTLN